MRWKTCRNRVSSRRVRRTLSWRGGDSRPGQQTGGNASLCQRYSATMGTVPQEFAWLESMGQRRSATMGTVPHEGSWLESMYHGHETLTLDP